MILPRLLENVAALSVLQGANYLLPLVTVPYLVRVLGPEKFGLLAFAQAFTAYFVIIADYGFSLSATRQVAIHRGDPRKIVELFSAVTCIKCVLMLAGFTLMMGIVQLVPRLRADWPVYWVSYVAVLGSVLFPVWLFQGMERMRYITGFTVTARLLMIAGIFLWVHRPGDYFIAAAFQAGGLVVAGVISVPVVLQLLTGRPIVPSRSMLGSVARSGWHVFVSTAAVSLNAASGTLVVGLVVGNVAAGFFSAADKIVKAAHGLLGPVSQSIYPYISALSAKSRARALAFIQRSLQWLGAGFLLVSLGLLLFARPIVMVVFGSQFQQTIPLLSWMAFVPFIVSLSNVFGIQTMLNLDLKVEFTRILVGCGLLNIVILVPLVHLRGAEGAAISVLLTELLVTLSMGLLLARRGIWPWLGRERTA